MRLLELLLLLLLLLLYVFHHVHIGGREAPPLYLRNPPPSLEVGRAKQDLKIDARRVIGKEAPQAGALNPPISKNRSLFFNFCSSPLFELFGLKLEAKKDPKYVENHIFNILLASSISCVDSTSLGTGFWSSQGDPDLPKALKKKMVFEGFSILSFLPLG